MSHGSTVADRSRVADAVAPLVQRRRRSRRRIALRIAVLVLLVALLGAGTWLVGFSRALDARSVAVSGNALVSADDVRRAAAVPLGRPMVGIDIGALARRVETVPAVRSARVERSWPHTVRIVVTERTPAVVVRSHGSSLLVDDRGIAYASVNRVPRGLIRADVDPGNAAVMAAVATVAGALPASVGAKVQRIDATSPEAIQLELTGHRKVIWGGPDQSSVKAEVIAALLPRHAQVYDVSGPANPTTRG